MNSEIKAIILDLGNYASNEKPQRNEHNVIIPFSLHYTDANLLFDYICELEEENEKLRKLCDSRYKYGSDMEGKYVVAQTKLDTVARYLLDHSLEFPEGQWDLEIEEVKDLYHYIKTGDWDRDRGDPCE
jgi:hypothetical protein